MQTKKIIDFSELIKKSTECFVGRQWVRDAVDDFLKAEGPRYFLLLGEPGSGKTAFMADLVKRGGYLHHFIDKGCQISLATSLEWRNPIRFAESIGNQLIRDYGGWIMNWEDWGISVKQEVKELRGLMIGVDVDRFKATPRPADKPILTEEQEVERLGPAAQIIGVYINKFIMDVEQIVHQLLTVPLRNIAERLPGHQVVIIVDGLDAAESYSDPSRNILKMLPDVPDVYLFSWDRIPGEYLFSWDGIPGNDNEKLIGFLKKKFDIKLEKAKIEKIDDGRTIIVSTKKNYLLLKLNDEKNEANLKIDDGRTDKFAAKMENGKLNIYSGNDNVKLTEFLKKRFGIEWPEKAKIEKIDGDRTIIVSTEKNYLLLKLNDEKNEVNLKIDDGRTDKFIAKRENDTTNIYLPANVRFLLSSRPGAHLTSSFLSQAQIFWLSEDENGKIHPSAIDDAKAYVLRLAEDDKVKGMLARWNIDMMLFAEQVARASKGNPLYLNHYAQGVRNGDETLLNLDALPESLYGIYNDFLGKIKEKREDVSWDGAYKPVLGTLAVAHEPLKRSQITDFSGVEQGTVGTILVQVKQFLHTLGKGDDRRYTIYHSSFIEYIVSEENEDYIDGRKAEAKIADFFLQRFKENWAKCDDYGLRHLISHLYALIDLEVYREWLFIIGKDKGFAAAQLEHFPDEPDMWHKAVQMALRAAAETDDAARMAEFTLLHAQQLDRVIEQQSPLDALRADGLKRAWELADMQNIERCVLWHFILAWELKDTGRLEDAHMTLERLLEKKLPSLSGWKSDYAVYLLICSFEISPSVSTVLHQRLLLDDDRRILREKLIAIGNFAGALEIARYIKDDWILEETYKRIAVAQAKAGDVATALKTLDRVKYFKHLREEALGEIAGVIAKAGDFKAAFDIADRIQDKFDIRYPQWEKSRAIREIAVAQAKAGDLNKAIKTLDRIKYEFPLQRARALEEIAVMQAKAGDFTLALSIVHEIQDNWERSIALKEIAVMKAKAGDFTSALDIVPEIRYEWGLSRDIREFSMGLERNHRGLAEAGGFAADKLSRYEVLRAEALGEIAVEQAKAGDFTAAIETFKKAIEIALKIDDQRPKDEALMKIAIVQAQAKDFTGAIGTALGIEDQRQMVETLMIIAVEQVIAKDVAGAIETTRRIEDQPQRYEALKYIAVVQAKEVDFTGAIEIALGIDDQHQKVEALMKIVVEQAKASDFASAFETTQKIKDKRKRAMALKEIAMAQVRAGDTSEARSTFAIALKTEQKIQIKWDRAMAMGEIAVALVRAVEVEKAREIFNSAIETAQGIDDQRDRAVAMGEIAVALVRAEEVDKARKIFDSAIETAQSIEDLCDKIVALREIAVALVRAMEIEKAQEIFNLAIETAQGIKDLRDRTVALGEIAVALVRVEKVEKAEEIFNFAFSIARNIEDERLRIEVGREIARAKYRAGKINVAFKVSKKFEVEERRTRALAQTRDFTKAIKDAKGVEDSRQRAVALAEIATALVRAEEVIKSEEVFNLAIETAQRIKDKWDQAVVLRKIAVQQARAGEKNNAQATFAAAIEIVLGIKDRWQWQRSAALSEIAIEQARAGFIDLAIETTQEIKEEEKRATALSEIEKAQFEAAVYERDVRKAEAFLTGSKEYSAKINKYLPEIARAYAESGNIEEFKQLLIPCAHYLDAAFRMCGYLALLYPEQAVEVAKVVIEFS